MKVKKRFILKNPNMNIKTDLPKWKKQFQCFKKSMKGIIKGLVTLLRKYQEFEMWLARLAKAGLLIDAHLLKRWKKNRIATIMKHFLFLRRKFGSVKKRNLRKKSSSLTRNYLRGLLTKFMLILKCLMRNPSPKMGKDQLKIYPRRNQNLWSLT